MRRHRKPLNTGRALACCTFILLCMCCVYQTFWDKYVVYVPSQLEVEWNQSIKSVMQSWPRLGCPLMLSHVNSGRVDRERSYHAFFPGNVKVFIEPLVGTLRHPETACFSMVGSRDAQAKWILLGNLPHVANGRRGVLFVDSYENSIWVQSLFPARFFEEVLPWRSGSGLLEANSKWKLDYTVAYIEHTDTASFNNQSMLLMLDEVFLDHRTHGSPMVKAWGQQIPSCTGDITSTYAILAALRHKGVRAHAV